MDGLDQLILGAAALLAVSTLVGLMIARRDKLVERFRQEHAQEKQRLAKEKKKSTDQRKAA